MIYGIDEIDGMKNAQKNINEKWVPARPVNIRTIRMIIKEVILIITGKADCLVWYKQ